MRGSQDSVEDHRLISWTPRPRHLPSIEARNVGIPCIEASTPAAPPARHRSRASPPTWRHAADDVSHVITNYEAVSDYVGHWLHRAQVSLLTGATLSHIAARYFRKKPCCGPGACGVDAESGRPARLRAPCSAAQTVRDGGRPLPVAGQRAGLGVSRQVILNKAGSAVLLVIPRSSSVASAGLRKPSSGIACRGVCCRGRGLGSSLDCTKSSR